MQLSALLSGVAVTAVRADMTREIPAIVSDSRVAERGALFLCLDGTRRDGHRYIADAVSRGAYAAVIREGERAPDGVPYIAVRDTRLAAAQIWNNRFGDPTRDMRVIAVTGTNGKTSVSHMLRAILKEAGYKTGMIGTVSCLCMDEELDLGGGGELSDTPAAMTTPDPQYLYGAAARMRDAGVEILILEATSHALDQRKLDAMHIDIALFTNLSEEHLDYHGTMDAYLDAKARLFRLAPVGIVNAADAYAEKLIGKAPACTFVRCSTEANDAPDVDATAVRIRMHGAQGISYIYYAKSTVFRVRAAIPGRFTAENTLLAATAALRLGVDPVTVQDALASFTGVAGRLERVALPGAPFSLFLDYAHTPAALESLLRTVREVRGRGQKITLLFGCGGDRDPSKRPAMGRIASALADLVILTADNSRSEDTGEILKSILRGMDREKPHVVIPDRREAIRYAVSAARAGEILLFAGKGHEKYEITAEGKFPFDEAEIARAAWTARQSKR